MRHMHWVGKSLNGLFTVLIAIGLGCAGGCGSPGGRAGIASQSAGTLMDLFGPPQGVSVSSNGLREAVLTWSAPVASIYRYRIERATTASGPFDLIAEVPPGNQHYTDGATAATQLADQTTYYYRILAVPEKNGPLSTPSTVVQTATAPPPAGPQQVQAKATGSRAVTVTWQASPSEGVDNYRVERAPTSDPAAYTTLSDRVAGTSFTDGGTPSATLKDSSSYFYRVTAINRVSAESVPSPPAQVTTLPPPTPVQGLTAVSRTVRCVPLQWNASPEPDVVRYDVYQAREANGPFEKIAAVQNRTTTQYTAGGGNPGTFEDEGTYFFMIRAVNAVTAESTDSATVRAITREVPPVVSQVKAVSAKPREIPLSWDVSPDTSVVGYEIWRARADDDNWVQVERTTAREVVNILDRGGEKDATRLGLLLDGTEYQYRVVAFNTAGVRSSASAPVKTRTKVIPIPPAGLKTTINLPYAVRLTWQANPEPDVNGYLVESSKKNDSGFRKLMVSSVTQNDVLVANELNLNPDEIRYYRIKALDREGLESEWSSVQQGNAKPLPDAPASVQSQLDGNTLIITWQPPPQPDVTSYNVWAAKFLFGWRLLGSTPAPEFRLELAPDEKPPKIAVTAIDKDKLESQRSNPLEHNR